MSNKKICLLDVSNSQKAKVVVKLNEVINKLAKDYDLSLFYFHTKLMNKTGIEVKKGTHFECTEKDITGGGTNILESLKEVVSLKENEGQDIIVLSDLLDMSPHPITLKDILKENQNLYFVDLYSQQLTHIYAKHVKDMKNVFVMDMKDLELT